METLENRQRLEDEFYIRKTFELANLGRGHVSPNPLVGAVIVKDGNILGVGHHEKYGTHHAEINAILDAKNKSNDLSGSTLYCNLEPCSHTNKQTPPCAPRIVEEKIQRVVISNFDPNPFVNGAGINLLKSFGIEVTTGVLEAEGMELNKVFFKFIQTKRPFVHLKMAQSLDGKIATQSGESKYITSPESLDLVHHYRQAYDCIMVGRNTVELDEPILTVRSEKILNKSHPMRLIVTSLNKINFSWKILNDEFVRNTMIISSFEEARLYPEKVIELEKRGVAFLMSETLSNGDLDFSHVFKSLGSLKFTSVLVEGGPTLTSSLLKQNLVDQVSIFMAPVFLGGEKSAVKDIGVEKLFEKKVIENKKVQNIGRDILIEGQLCSLV